jgi:hypothetical protein
LHNIFIRENSADGVNTPRESLAEENDIGFDVPVFETEKLAGSCDPGLDFVGNE